jgi:adenosine deaminase
MRSYAELHVHIEGALEPELAFALAKKNNVELPFANAGELRKRFTYESQQDFLNLYYANMAVLQTEEDFAELANSYLAKAKAAGVTRAEISCDLQAHLARGVPAEVVLSGLNAALSKSEEAYGISTGLILNFPQHVAVEEAADAYDKAVATGTELLAVGVCLTQAGVSASRFSSLFGKARGDGLHTVAHVGVEAGIDVVWECLHALRVGRIGSCAVEDSDLMYYLADYSIPLTVCPLANAALHGAKQAQHPMPRLLEEGVVVTINSDAPAYFGGYLDANIAAVTAEFGLTEEQLDLLARNSFAGAFLAESKKLQLAGELIPA